MKTDNYPMQGAYCGALTRAREPCRNLPMNNGRCRLHGGKSKTGMEHGRYRTGEFTKQAIACRRELREFWRVAKEMIGKI